MKHSPVLNGKVVFVTGGGRGIGSSVAEACAAQGAKVAILARTVREVQETSDKINKLGIGVAKALTCDVTRTEDIQAAVDQTEKELGPIYGLIAAAGIYGPIGPFHTLPLEDWQKALDINLMGTVRTCHVVLQKMAPRKQGRIVLFSGGGQGPLPNFSSYVAGKGAILRLTETLGAEYASSQIFVNCIAPGAVNTRFLDELIEAGPEKTGEEFYQKSLKQRQQGGVPPEKAAELAVYLLSDAAAGLWGKNLSAVWDPYREFQDLEALSRSDIYTSKRVVSSDGRTR